jgi:hypothetical protein
VTLTNSNTGQVWNNDLQEDVFPTYPIKDWSNYKVHFRSLVRQLVSLESIPNLDVIFAADMRMPLSMVRMLRDTGYYLPSKSSRGFTIAGPTSNSAFSLAGGLLPGAYLALIHSNGKPVVDPKGTDWIAETAVHELCHVIDAVAIVDIKSGRKQSDYPWAYPEVFALRDNRNDLFVGHPDSYGKTLEVGFITDYSQANGAEDLAEHCTYYVLQNDYFYKKALEQSQAGNTKLMDKFNFMKDLFEHRKTIPIPSVQ